MSKNSKLRAFAVKTRFLGGNEPGFVVPDSLLPIDRIVGIAACDHTQGSDMWTPEKPNPYSFGLEYTRGDAYPVDIELPHRMVSAFVNFFGIYYVDRLNGEFLSYKKRQKNQPNCHRLAYWLTDNELANSELSPKGPDNSQPIEHLLPAGRHAVLVHESGYPMHSAISMPRGKLLQVFGCSAIVGICSYEKARAISCNQVRDWDLHWREHPIARRKPRLLTKFRSLQRGDEGEADDH